MITYYNNTLNMLAIEKYKSCNARVLLIKNIADSLERATVSIISLSEYVKNVKVCTLLSGGYRFSEQEVRGFNSSQLIPEFRGTDVDKLVKQFKCDSTIIVPPIMKDMPSQPILGKAFLGKLSAKEEMKNKNLLVLLEEKEWSTL